MRFVFLFFLIYTVGGCDAPGACVLCPHVRTIPPAAQKTLALELQPLAADSQIVQSLIDYKLMRDEARRCAHDD